MIAFVIVLVFVITLYLLMRLGLVVRLMVGLVCVWVCLVQCYGSLGLGLGVV